MLLLEYNADINIQTTVSKYIIYWNNSTLFYFCICFYLTHYYYCLSVGCSVDVLINIVIYVLALFYDTITTSAKINDILLQTNKITNITTFNISLSWLLLLVLVAPPTWIRLVNAAWGSQDEWFWCEINATKIDEWMKFSRFSVGEESYHGKYQQSHHNTSHHITSMQSAPYIHTYIHTALR